MSLVKRLIVKPISRAAANLVVKEYHYSGKTCNSTQINLGVFLDDRLVGAAQFGAPLNKRKMASSLKTGMNEFLELNRLAISDECGKNTESRVLGICLRLLKKKYKFLRCIVSFSDATQCGDGIIYRASNFKLVGYSKNKSILKLTDEALAVLRKYKPNAVHITACRSIDDHKTSNGKGLSSTIKKMSGVKPLDGYQMKYVYFYDKKLEKIHTSIPFDKIPNDVKMYKGIKRVEHESNASDYQLEESGAIPTSTLQNKSGDL